MQAENLFTPDCIRTNSGLYVNVFDPKPDMFKIDDVAHALSMQSRFGGHLPVHYSVAQHCLEVCNMVPDEYKLDALMHDASEAFLLDIPSPIKKRLPNYKSIENNLMNVLADVFEFSWPMPDAVKEADEKCLVDEWENVFLTTKKNILTQQESKTCFINKFNQLKNTFNKSDQSSSEEILNLDHHIKILLLKALNKFRYKTQAFRALCISEKQLFNLIEKYNIKLEKGKYIISNETAPNEKSNQPIS